MSARFNIERGCRQGDPIASYLFIICIEILAHKLRSDQNIKGFEIGNFSHLLEIYADDLTIFLTPNSENLRRVLETLDNFFHLSGLKISVSKTKAVWFGTEFNSDRRLCPDLKLQWVKNFTLLGINFNNNLDHMENNFSEKLEKIQKMLSCWFYRYITPFGKVTIIKTLALAKLSHVALIIPNPTKQMFKQIETTFFNFIWNNKSEKVRREDAKLPEKLGGLNVPDVEQFWLSFKFSWLRRLLTTKAFWPNIVLNEISNIQNSQVTPTELLQLGPALLCNMGKKLKNKFWQQVLFSAMNITEGAIFSHPEKLSTSSFWYNPFIRRNNKVIRHNDFVELNNSISTLSDFFYPCSNEIMNKDDFCARHNVDISENKYIDLRYVITLALQKMRLPREKLLPVAYPFKPLLIDIALSTQKGCSIYYKLLMKKRFLRNNNGIREQKWHAELNCRFSVNFWDKCRKLYASICHENPIKWLQFQIVRNSLQTNVIVSHFKNNVNPACQYCQNSDEKISHLFWLCPIVSGFLVDIFALVCSTGLSFTPTREQFLFGYLDQPYNTPCNYLVLFLKKFIWSSKFKTNINLSLVGFKNYLKYVLFDLKLLYELKNKSAEFNVWNDLLALLPAADPLQADQDGLLPAQVSDLLLPASPPRNTQTNLPPP